LKSGEIEKVSYQIATSEVCGDKGGIKFFSY